MTKNIKLILIIVGGVFLFLLLLIYIFGSQRTATNNQPVFPTGPVTLQVWKPFADSAQMQELIAAYQQKRGNVTIDFRKPDCSDEFCSDYETEILNAMARGEGPDIFSIHNTWLPQYLDKVASSTNFSFKDYNDTFVDVVVSEFTRDQKIYGVALSVDTLGLYYNKDLLGSQNLPLPPKTWDELARFSRILTQRNRQTGFIDQTGVAIGTAGKVYRAQDIVYLFMLQKGARPWSGDGLQPTFADTVNFGGAQIRPGAEAVTFYTSFANPRSENYTWNALSHDSLTAFVQGNAAFFFGYSFSRDDIQSKNALLNFDVAAVPQPELGKPLVNYANYWGEVVNKQSKNQIVAWDFLKFITSAEVLKKYHAVTRTPSSRKDLIAEQLDDPYIGVFASSALTAKSFYKPHEAKMDTIIKEMINDIILRGRTPEDAITQAQIKASGLSQVRF